MTTDTSICELSPLPVSVRSLTNVEARVLNSRFVKSRSTVADCVTCGGAQTFQWFAPGSRADVVTYRCPCRDQHRLSRFLWHCGVMPRYQTLSWSDFERLPDQAASAAMDYLERLEAYCRAGFGLILTGPRGTGKTLLAHLILKDVIAKGIDCYATSFTEMIDTYAGGWRDDAQAKWFDRRVRDAGVLLVDDLGRERNKGEGSVGENMLETVVRHRVKCNLPTIVTSNITPDNIETAYGGHTQSLLDESAIYIDVPGLDSRRDMQNRERDYLVRGLTRPVVLA